jgi:hypothetical protein
MKTSDAVAQACAKIEIQPGCTGSWTDIGGEATTITLPKQAITTGSVPVFNDDNHVITTGKKEPITATISAVYTEVAGEAFELVRAIWQTEGCNKALCVRATPKGGDVGDLEIYIGDPNTNAFLSGFMPPNLSAAEGGPAVFEFDVFGTYEFDTKAS